MNNDKEFDDMIASQKEYIDALRQLDEKIKEVLSSQQEALKSMTEFIKAFENHIYSND